MPRTSKESAYEFLWEIIASPDRPTSEDAEALRALTAAALPEVEVAARSNWLLFRRAAEFVVGCDLSEAPEREAARALLRAVFRALGNG